MSIYPDCSPRCQHIKVNGTQCGSPALRRNRLCYFHNRWNSQQVRINSRARAKSAVIDLPVLEDANSIQVTLMQIMRLLAAGQLDHKTAGLLLYALQTASFNLRRISFEPIRPTKVLLHPRDAAETPLGEDPWDPSMFEEEEPDESGEQSAKETTESGIDIQAVAEDTEQETVSCSSAPVDRARIERSLRLRAQPPEESSYSLRSSFSGEEGLGHRQNHHPPQAQTFSPRCS